MPRELYIGLMSGTSLDGVDGALVDFGERQTRLLATAHINFPAEVKVAALALLDSAADELHRCALLAQRLAHLYAATVAAVLAQVDLQPGDILAVGCHGQTLRHRPADGYTLLMGALTSHAINSNLEKGSIKYQISLKLSFT